MSLDARTPGVRAWAAGALLAALPLFSHAQDDKVALGHQLYNENCARCHGFNLVNPGTTFDLRVFPPDQNDRFLNSVKRGKNAMPAWGDKFDDAQLTAIWSYILATQPK